jgi:hypothetical protein
MDYPGHQILQLHMHQARVLFQALISSIRPCTLQRMQRLKLEKHHPVKQTQKIDILVCLFLACSVRVRTTNESP